MRISNFKSCLGTLALALGLALSATLAGADAAALRLVHTVPLPQTAGRFDHCSIDAAGNRLFIAALGNDTAEIVDLEKFARIHTIRGLHKPTGVAYLPEVGRIVAANGGDGTLQVFDGATFGLLAQLTDLDDADNVRVDAAENRIYVGFANGALGVTDIAAKQLLARIPLKGHPESFQLEQSGTRIFVNVPDSNMIAVVDRAKASVVAQWPMEKFRANFPMALNEANHRLFVGCRRPARLVIFDTVAGKPVSDLEISGDTDDLFFDAKRQRLYVSCGEGFIDIIQCRDGDRYERIARLPTRSGARTSFFSPELDRLYLAVPQRGGHDAELRIYQPN